MHTFSHIPLLVVYVLNIFITGYVGIASLFFPHYAAKTLFEGTVTADDSVRVSGAVWLAMSMLSIAGIWIPLKMLPVLCIQLIYKGLWLIVVALPLALQGKTAKIPKIMATIFIIYVVGLSVIIPFDYFLGP